MTRRIGIIAALSKPEAKTLGDEITAWLVERGFEAVPESDLSAHGTADVEAVIVLGGDGLMMRSANVYPDIPLLGINFGKVGFLALVEQQVWRPAVQNLIDGNFGVETSSTLEATLIRGDQSFEQGWAINDVVIRSGSRMVDVEVYIDGHFVNTYPGDGMIVSTARGSTAYCMAAGGPILTAGVRGFAIVPISCHSPIRTPVVVSESVDIELVVTNDHDSSLILDGSSKTGLQKNDVVSIRRGVHTFQLVTFGSTNFYDAIREKFNFQIRPDVLPTRYVRRLAARTAQGSDLQG